MTHPSVHLNSAQRQRVLNELLKSFGKWRVPVAAISVGRVHFHLLWQFPRHDPRHYVGLTKKESSAYMRRDGLAPPGGLWAFKSECVPIKNESHWLSVIDYIIAHAKKGSVAWKRESVTRGDPPHPDGLLVD